MSSTGSIRATPGRAGPGSRQVAVDCPIYQPVCWSVDLQCVEQVRSQGALAKV